MTRKNEPNQVKCNKEDAVVPISGFRSFSETTGLNGTAIARGVSSNAHAKGDSGLAVTNGHRGAASSDGEYGISMAKGFESFAIANGPCSMATAIGYSSTATAHKENCLALGLGIKSKACGVTGSVLILAEWNTEGTSILSTWSGVVGLDGIKPNTPYTLVDGKPVEVGSDESGELTPYGNYMESR